MIDGKVSCRHIYLFKTTVGDGGGPIVDQRPVFDVRTGAETTRERIERVLRRRVEALWVGQAHQASVEQDHPGLAVCRLPEDGSWMLVNSRWLGAGMAKQVAELSVGSSLLQEDGQVIAAHLEAEAARWFVECSFRDLPPRVRRDWTARRVLVERPWEVLEQLGEVLGEDLEASLLPAYDGRGEGVEVVGDRGVKVASDATVQPHVVFLAERGPVVVDRGAVIGGGDGHEQPKEHPRSGARGAVTGRRYPSDRSGALGQSDRGSCVHGDRHEAFGRDELEDRVDDRGVRFCAKDSGSVPVYDRCGRVVVPDR